MIAAPIRLTIVVFAASLALFAVGPRPALAATTITVNNALSDIAEPDNFLTLREAMMLATGDLLLEDLTEPECGQVSGTIWFSVEPAHCTTLGFPQQPPGASSADTIVFDPINAFPPDNPKTIVLGSALPTLDTGNDTVDGSGAGVIIAGLDRNFTCIAVNSNSNTVKGLHVHSCDRGIQVSTIGPETNDNVIGGTTAAERNAVYDNFIGVLINGEITGNRVIGNYIGVDEPNDWGVFVGPDSDGNFIGGDTPGERNVISGNVEAGIEIASSDGNTISGNYIGTNVTGTGPLPNGIGVSVGSNASSNVIDGNLISGNDTGVLIENPGSGASTGNIVSENLIGTDAAGTADIPNNIGVLIREEANSNVIEENLISGNASWGVEIAGEGTESNVVSGNFIGVDVTGTNALPNTPFGVLIWEGADGNIVGGDSSGERNVISGNSDAGVLISGEGTSENVVSGNYMGTDVSGSNAVPNISGVSIADGAGNNVIGGDSPGERNVISGNGNSGVRIDGSETNGNSVSGNYIGPTESGEDALGQGGYGIQLSGLTGGNLMSENVIAGSGFVGGPSVAGIAMFGANANEIYENRIGISPSGAPLGNDLFGIYMRDSSNNIIGDVDGGGNIIAFNGGDGVRVTTDGGDSVGNTVRGNSIYSNDGLAINNEENGNLELAQPVITGFGSVMGTACPDCTVDVYSDDEDEGRIYEGSTVADGAGDWTFGDQPLGPNATATATDLQGNTSEFSQPAVVPDPATPTPTPTPTVTATPTATPMGTSTPTPTPTPTPGAELAQGDNDCDGDTDAVDALKGLQDIAAIDYEQEEGCPEIGGAVPAGEPPEVFGDVDCDGDVDAVDALKILQFVAAIPFTQNEPCVDVGEAF